MMTNIFQKLVPGGLLYIRIKRDWLSVRDVKTGHCYEDIPVAAISAGEDGDILAVGFAAHSLEAGVAQYTIVNGFEDPRMIIANAGVAEYTLRYFMDSVVKKGLLQPPLKVILHPTEFRRGKLSRRAACIVVTMTLFTS